MSLEAYKVAVRISLVDGVTRGLQMMSRHFKQTDADAKLLEARMKSIAKQAAVGGALVAGGFGALGLLKGPLDEAKKYQEELARFASLGFGARVNAEAQAYAEGMKAIGTSTSENMSLVADAMAVFKDLRHAEMAAPIMATMKFTNRVLFGDSGGERDQKFMDLLKVIEFRGGLSSDAEFKRQADFAQKVISGSRGRVDATAMLQALKTGGVALSRRNNDAFFLGGEPLIQEFGGSRYGTAAMSIYQNLVQSRGTITAQQELYRLGLLDPKRVMFNKLGQLKKALPGSFYGSQILEQQGEMALLDQVLLPAFARKGITTEEGIIRELGMILGNRTGSGLMARIFQQEPILKRQMAANRKAFGIDELMRPVMSTAKGREIQLEARERDLKLQIGKAILPMYVKGLELAAAALTKLNNFAEHHKPLVKAAVMGFAIVATAAAVGGGLTLVSAGLRGLLLVGKVWPVLRIGGVVLSYVAGAFGLAAKAITLGIWSLGRAFLGFMLTNPIGWMILGIVALGVAAYELYKHWDQVKAFVSPIWASLKEGFLNFINWVIRGVNRLSLGLVSIPEIPTAPAVSGGTVRPGGHLTQKAGDVYLDGKKVGQVMTPHLLSNAARTASRPNQGKSTFDSSRSWAPPSALTR